MAIITISRGSYSRGKEVAEEVARRLGYECIAREVLLDASEHYRIPEIKLSQSIQDAPSILDRMAHGKRSYVAFIRAALLRRVQKDDVVYHGFAGHFFLGDIPHVLKVRILADPEDRIRLVMQRDGLLRRDAIRFLRKVDDERRKWSRTLYGMDTWDANLYDVVLNIKKITVDAAADIICHTASLEEFRTTPLAQQALDDLVLASEVNIALAPLGLDLEVSARSGNVNVVTKAPKSQEGPLALEIERIAKQVTGVREIRVEVIPLMLFE